VIAAAYAERYARLHELALEIDFAGTEPDKETAPVVVAKLLSEGIDVSQYVPRLVTAEDMEKADVIISIGCDIEPEPRSGRQILHWDNVPPPSQGIDEACQIIENNVVELLGS
jgi:protein-tyrosine-phosphatase